MSKSPSISRALVLGAGFTKAFFPNAPLLVDHYDVPSLEWAVTGLEHAGRVLALECKRNQDGRINIERLMTRLDSGMPYDKSRKAEEELAVLLAKLKEVFIERVNRARAGDSYRKELLALARSCIMNSIHCVTYNYDDILDEALFDVGGHGSGVTVEHGNEVRFYHWNADTGYGFPCEAVGKTLSTPYMTPLGQPFAPHDSSLFLLKLHGSMNWRIPHGEEPPVKIRSIVHLEEWKPPLSFVKADAEAYLEPAPFIVPPILVKSDLVDQPILRFIWGKAYEVLKAADEVTFIGYSFPATDVASVHLFGEAIDPTKTRVRVVNLAEPGPSQVAIVESYRRVFPGLTEDSFDFRGGLDWSREFVGRVGEEGA